MCKIDLTFNYFKYGMIGLAHRIGTVKPRCLSACWNTIYILNNTRLFQFEAFEPKQ